MIHFGLISVIPEIVAGLKLGVTGRAIHEGITTFNCWNLRDWGVGVHQQVDDKPYGGGPGMVMMFEPLSAAIHHARRSMPESTKVIYLSPQGRVIQQQDLNKIAANKQSLLFIAGRYEGIDERIIDQLVDEEWSLGDFVLSGGEIAAMAFIDAIVRLLPGSLGHSESAAQDSFMNGFLDCPHYTRPASIQNLSVPEVLLSGNHRKIAQWRRKQSLGMTWLKRPGLIQVDALSDTDKQLLNEFQCEQGK